MNDPFDGGMHLPDIFVFKPIFHDGERLAFACTVCHHTDVGGRVAGSNASDSTEIYAEGLRIPPLKLYERGQAQRDLIALHREERARAGEGVRRPARAARRLPHRREAVRRAGRAVRRRADQALHAARPIDYAERLTRAALARAARRRVELRGLDRRRRHRLGKPIRLFVTLRKTRRPHGRRLDRHHRRRSRARSTTRCRSPRPRPTPACARCCRTTSPTTRACSAPSR